MSCDPQGTRAQIADLGVSTWGRGRMEWSARMTGDPGRIDAVPITAGAYPRSRTTRPYSLKSYDIYSLGILAARLLIWASGATQREWSAFPDVTPAARASFKEWLLSRAEAYCRPRMPELWECIANWTGDSATRHTPQQGLARLLPLLAQHGTDPDAPLQHQQAHDALHLLGEVGTCEALWRLGAEEMWRCLEAIGFRPTPRNFYHLVKDAKNWKALKASAPEAPEACHGGNGEGEGAAGGGITLDPATAHQLIREYIQAKEPGRAEQVLHELRTSGTQPSLEAYQLVVEAYVRFKQLAAAERVRKMMVQSGIPSDKLPYTALIEGYGRVGGASEIETLMTSMQTSEPPVQLTHAHYQALLNAYSLQGRPDKASEVPGRMAANDPPILPDDTRIYPDLVKAYAYVGQLDKAEQLIQGMKGFGYVPRAYAYNYLLNGFGEAGRLDEARALITTMEADGVAPAIGAYKTLLYHFCAHQRFEEAEALLARMELARPKVRPDGQAYTYLIEAYAGGGMVDKAMQTSQRMELNGVAGDENGHGALLSVLFTKDRKKVGYAILNQFKGE